MKPFLFIFILLIPELFQVARAQDLVDHTAIQNELKGENAVFLKRKESAEIFFDKEQLKIRTKVMEDLLILNDKGSIYNERSVYFSHFQEIKDLDAKTLIPEGKSYRTVRVSDFTKKNDVSSGVFYDDHQAINFTFPGLKAGARAIYSYEEIQAEPRFFGIFFFGSYIDSKEAELEVLVPSNVKIKYRLFGSGTEKVVFKEIKTKKYTILSWKAKDMKKFDTAPGAPNIRYHTPHIILYVDEYTNDDKTTKLLSDASHLYKWYRSLVKDLNKTDDEGMKKLVDSLTFGLKDDLARVKAIFYWIQDNIKYVAFEDGLGGFVPREAVKVCEKRYGDCKDMASIINQMLHLAGIRSYLTWIGSRDVPYTYDQVPTPQSDNHMITTWISPDNKYYFLDATGKNAPIDMYTSMIQGKEALIGMDEENCVVVTIPEVPKERNIVIDYVSLLIEGSELKGSGGYAAEGYEKIRFGERLQNMNDADKVKYLKSYLQKGNNKFSADSLTYENLKDRTLPLLMKYYFTLPDYLKINGEEIYVNLHIDKTNQNAILDPEKRTVGLELDFKSVDKHITKIRIPQGYEASFIPPDVLYEGKKFGIRVQYIQKEGYVILEKVLTTDILLIQPSDFPEWNKMIKMLNMAYNESIILKKKK